MPRFKMGKPKHPVHRGWDVSKWPLMIGALMTVATQLVSMRGQLIDQEAKNATTAVTQAAMQRDIAKLSGTVFGKQLEPRVTRLEKPKKLRPLPTYGGVKPDSLARSRGMLAKVARTPLVVWGAIKRMFQGGNHDQDATGDSA